MCPDNINPNHQKFMRIALDLAELARGYTAPNPMVGCVIVKNNKIIGQGYHRQAGQNHAEINAINNALNNLADNHSLDRSIDGSTCYVTLEPCCHHGKTGPCVEAVLKHKLKTVVIAMEDPNPLVAGKSIQLLQDAGLEVIVGVCEQEATELNKGFISRVTNKRPFIRSKIAASLDGNIALDNGQSKWITNELSRLDVHYMRMYSDAIVTTASTVIADNPKLNVRLNLNLNLDTQSDFNYIKQPVRVVLDQNLDTDASYDIYNQEIAKTILITCQESLDNKLNVKKIKEFEARGIEMYSLALDKNNNKINIVDLWAVLAELGCNDVMVEAGPRFNGYLLSNNLNHNLIDEWVVYQSGFIMGQQAMSMFNIDYMTSMDSLIKLKCVQIKQFDDNWRLVLTSTC